MDKDLLDHGFQSYLTQIEMMAAESFLVGKLPPRIAIARAVTAFPHAAISEVVFAFLSVQTNLGHMFERDAADLSALEQEVNQACALLAADLYALQAMGSTTLSCAELVRFWGAQERFFVTDMPY